MTLTNEHGLEFDGNSTKDLTIDEANRLIDAMRGYNGNGRANEGIMTIEVADRPQQNNQNVIKNPTVNIVGSAVDKYKRVWPETLNNQGGSSE